jgi:ribonuclease-3
VARRKASLDDLQARLGYFFSDLGLLERALTHVSAAAGGPAQSYQRLEFLGDRVLGLAVADLLFAAFPDAPEGELSRRLSELVRKESCAEVADRWDLGAHLRLGTGEVQSGGRRNRTILADATEAVIGAVFLDGGFPIAKALVQRAFAESLAAPRQAMRDPKSALQEWVQGRGLAAPRYTVVEQIGPDHAPQFRIMVTVDGLEGALGSGQSKRVAEQDAARHVLMREGVWTEGEHAGA